MRYFYRIERNQRKGWYEIHIFYVRAGDYRLSFKMSFGKYANIEDAVIDADKWINDNAP